MGVATIRQANSKDILRLLELYRELDITRSDIEDSQRPSKADYEHTLERIQSTPGLQLLVIEGDGETAATVVKARAKHS
jgi:hypothetical protein